MALSQQVDLGHELPMGPPQLMMSFTADGQLDAAALQVYRSAACRYIAAQSTHKELRCWGRCHREMA